MYAENTVLLQGTKYDTSEATEKAQFGNSH